MITLRAQTDSCFKLGDTDCPPSTGGSLLVSHWFPNTLCLPLSVSFISIAGGGGVRGEMDDGKAVETPPDAHSVPVPNVLSQGQWLFPLISSPPTTPALTSFV